MRLVFPILLALGYSTKKSAIFEYFLFVPRLLFWKKMAIFNAFRKKVISRLIGLFICGVLHSTNLG